MLSKLLPILEDSGLELRQQIILNKGMQAVSGRATKNYKMFPTVTESILFLYKDSKPFAKELLKRRQKELGLSAKAINEQLGVKSNGGGMWSIYTGENVCKQLPTEELWNKLQAPSAVSEELQLHFRQRLNRQSRTQAFGQVSHCGL